MPVNAVLGIKSIQRGTITIPAGQISGSATITAVNTSKTILRFLGVRTNEPTDADGSNARLWLTNSTTVGAVRGVYPTTYSTFVGFEAVEYF